MIVIYSVKSDKSIIRTPILFQKFNFDFLVSLLLWNMLNVMIFPKCCNILRLIRVYEFKNLVIN